MNVSFNKSFVITNPLRILFLCGSHFSRNTMSISSGSTLVNIIDKRLVLKNFLENNILMTNKTIILEDNFMFSDSGNLLNYNDINLKSLKSIELLTMLYSNKVIVLHESFSTAAEIGMFSTADNYTDKLLVLTPDIHTFNEDFITGFMKLSYQNKFYNKHNIRFINYYPAIYDFHLTNKQIKYHSYFPNNELNKHLKDELLEILNSNTELKIKFGSNKKYSTTYYEVLDKQKIKINIKPIDLLSYILAIMNLKTTVEIIRKKVDFSDLKNSSESNKRKKLFNEKKKSILNLLKELFFNTLKTEMVRVKSQNDIKIELKTDLGDVSIHEAIQYILYLLFAMSFIKFKENDTRFSIDKNFHNVYERYKSLIDMEGV